MTATVPDEAQDVRRFAVDKALDLASMAVSAGNLPPTAQVLADAAAIEAFITGAVAS